VNSDDPVSVISPNYEDLLSKKFISKGCQSAQFGAGVACQRQDTLRAAAHFNAPLVSIYANTPTLTKIKLEMQHAAMAFRLDNSFLPLVKKEIIDEVNKYAPKNPIDLFMVIQEAPTEEVKKGCQLVVHDWAFFGIGPHELNYSLPLADSIRRNLLLAVFEESGRVINNSDNIFINNKPKAFDVHYHDKLWSPDNRRIICPENKNTSFWSLVMDDKKSAITLHWLVDSKTMHKFVDIFWKDKNPDGDPHKLTIKEWFKSALKEIPGSSLLDSLYSLIPRKYIFE